MCSYIFNNIVACTAANKKLRCWLRCKPCQESFFGTLCKGGSLLTFYRKCQGPIIQKCDTVRSLHFLSSLLTPCQCCSLGNGTVKDVFFSKMSWGGEKKKKKKDHIHESPMGLDLTPPGRYVFNYTCFFLFLRMCDKHSVIVWIPSSPFQIFFFCRVLNWNNWH